MSECSHISQSPIFRQSKSAFDIGKCMASCVVTRKLKRFTYTLSY